MRRYYCLSGGTGVGGKSTAMMQAPAVTRRQVAVRPLDSSDSSHDAHVRR